MLNIPNKHQVQYGNNKSMKYVEQRDTIPSEGMDLPLPKYDRTSLEVIEMKLPRYEWNYLSEDDIG